MPTVVGTAFAAACIAAVGSWRRPREFGEPDPRRQNPEPTVYYPVAR